jgi:hypothetical protein
MQTKLEKIYKETENLTFEERLELVERLIRELRTKIVIKKEYLNWSDLYGLGKGLWQDKDAQEYVNQLREDR